MQIGSGIMEAGKDQDLLPLERTRQYSFDLAELVVAIPTSLILTRLLQHQEDTIQHGDVVVHPIFDTLHIVRLGLDRREGAYHFFGTFWAFLISFNREQFPVACCIQKLAFTQHLEKTTLEEGLTLDAFLGGCRRTF